MAYSLLVFFHGRFVFHKFIIQYHYEIGTVYQFRPLLTRRLMALRVSSFFSVSLRNYQFCFNKFWGIGLKLNCLHDITFFLIIFISLTPGSGSSFNHFAERLLTCWYVNFLLHFPKKGPILQNYIKITLESCICLIVFTTKSRKSPGFWSISWSVIC